MKNVMLMCATLALGLVMSSASFAAVPVADNTGGNAANPSDSLPAVSCADCARALTSQPSLGMMGKGVTMVGAIQPPQPEAATAAGASQGGNAEKQRKGP